MADRAWAHHASRRAPTQLRFAFDMFLLRPIRLSCLLLGPALFTGMASGAATAQEPPAEQAGEQAEFADRLAVGQMAPPFHAERWWNVVEGAEPGVERFAGRPAVVAFWASDSQPCLSLLPQLRDLRARFPEQEVGFALLSYQDADSLASWLSEQDFELPIGVDPGRASIDAYGVRRWPTTLVLDAQGRVSFIGTPAGAVAVLEGALGRVPEAASLLSSCIDALLRQDEAAAQAGLCRLVERAPTDFDLQSWAAQALGVDRGEPGAEQNGARALGQLVKSAMGGDKKRRRKALNYLADKGPDRFDLRTWSVQSLQQFYPVTAAELSSLLESERFEDVLFALLHRRPTPACFEAAADDRALRKFAKKAAAAEQQLAERALLTRDWLLRGDGPVRDPERFWKDLDAAHVQRSEEGSVESVLVDGWRLRRGTIDAFVDDRHARFVLMKRFGLGRDIDAAELAKEVDKVREQSLRRLRRVHGKPATSGD